MSVNRDQVCGIDLGTGGLRALVSTIDGEVVGAESGPARVPFRLSPGWLIDERDDGRHEQDPREWRVVLLDVLGRLFARLPQPRRVGALACTSTSGTLLALDANGDPLGPAIMYDDVRGNRLALLAARAGARYLMSATDYLNQILMGEPVASDYTNASKYGFRVETGEWDQAWLAACGVRADMVSRPVPTGRRMGRLRDDLCQRWGLRARVGVVAGATDGNTGFYASGATQPGDYHVGLGSTMVVRTRVAERIVDPSGRMYCHAHPDGGWVLAGASNVSVRSFVLPPVDDAGSWDALRVPRVITYPLPGVGERLPFACPRARFFVVEADASPIAPSPPGAAPSPPAATSPPPSANATLDLKSWHSPDAEFDMSADQSSAPQPLSAVYGAALAERWILDIAVSLGAPRPTRVYTTGTGAREDAWMRLRAGVLGVETARAEQPDSAFGAAILAAASVAESGVSEMARRMVRIAAVFPPEERWRTHAAADLQRLQKAAAERGYL
jgi:xylulokinase